VKRIKKGGSVTAKDILSCLRLESCNFRDFNIKCVRPPDNLCDESFTLLTRPEEFDELFRSAPSDVAAVIPVSLKEKAKGYKQLFMFSENSRLSYIKALNAFFLKDFVPHIAKSAVLNSEGTIDKNVIIGEHTVISGDVQIGAGTEIKENVVINGSVTIGKNVLIKSGTVIGQKGFYFEYDESGVPLAFPHFGRVIIGDHVEIGALNTVVQGTLSDTIISDYVKTNDHVHIAHNVKIGFGALIAACVEISGSAIIGSRAWLAPNCSIRDHISLGNNVFVGLGAVVTKSFPDDVVVVGNPARRIRTRGRVFN